MNSLVTILGAFGVAGLVAAVPALIGTLRSLRANQPKTLAEAESAQATANRTNIAAQSEVIGILREELARQATTIDQLQGKVNDLELRDERNGLAVEVAERQARNAVEQKRALIATLKAFSDWTSEYYDAGHPPGMRPPPKFYA